VRGSADSCTSNMTSADCNSAYEKLFAGCKFYILSINSKWRDESRG
jgi:formylmethanofuran dehydrogenase subunit E-like metal-binding protein